MHNCKEYLNHCEYVCDNTTCNNKLHQYKICKNCIAWTVGAAHAIDEDWKELLSNNVQYITTLKIKEDK